MSKSFILPIIKNPNTQRDSGVQAIIFRRDIWTEETAKQWLEEHKYKPIKKVHITTNYLRYRLLSPTRFESYFSITLDNGIILIMGYTLL